MNLAERIQGHFEQSARIKLECATLLSSDIALASDRILQCVMNDGKVLACGNGSSASTAQQFTATMVNRFEQERPGLATVALTADATVLTSIANHYSYRHIFARQVLALGQPGDVLLAISVSGNSESVLRAAQAAQERDMSVIALTSMDGGNLAEQMTDNDVLIRVPVDNAARVQEVHLLIIHCLSDTVDCALLGVT
jgi:D-sedoheptulose 7-phosphate isomerase